MMRTRRAPTIKDVAHAACVSTATVSKILSGQESAYAADTVQRVRATAREMRYVPNGIARTLSKRRTHLVSVVWSNAPNLRVQPYFLEVLAGILNAAQRIGYQVTLFQKYERDLAESLSHLGSGFFEGAILMVPRHDDPLLAWVKENHFPAVVVGETFPEAAGVSCVDVDSATGMYEAVRWLAAEQGHRKVGYIGGPDDLFTARIRRAAYERALREAGVEPHPEWIRSRPFGEHSGKILAGPLYADCPDLTAIVCATDSMAIGAMHALQETGVRIPEEVSLLGFDDVEMARVVRPALTTVHQPMFDVGVTATEMLLEQIETGDLTPRTRLLPTSLVIRDSVRPVATARAGLNVV
jgi:DNA-binding LacI/PurR family transcriptional regulator